eukprot:gnl/MRDRNA2_/MRDRNA2_72642_c0_seq1.p1 gnl/MRDRNA2_/MRDRNA2_72642_c0~~gnl/MRDRNA2_/MRDRNA2_72642_c0_seq1.p1  ORF type:complete len:113 (-),score=10.43 gnl/MRDRNA2_/MRDRNA2_72642_c0_seq1:82-420(-)
MRCFATRANIKNTISFGWHAVAKAQAVFTSSYALKLPTHSCIIAANAANNELALRSVFPNAHAVLTRPKLSKVHTCYNAFLPKTVNNNVSKRSDVTNAHKVLAIPWVVESSA